MKKKIFFTFSSQGNAQKNRAIECIIDTLDKSRDFEIAHRWFEKESTPKNSCEIYEDGIKQLLSSDLILAEVSKPSTGVGQQIAFGMFHKIPVLVLAQQEFKKTAQSLFLKGTKSTQVSFYYYLDEEDIKSNLIQTVKSKISDDYEKLNFMATKSIKKTLIEESKKRGVSQSELLRQIITNWKDKNAV